MMCTKELVLESLLVKILPSPDLYRQKDASTINFSSILHQLKREKAGSWAWRDELPPIFLLVSALSGWFLCLGSKHEIWGALSGMCLKDSNLSILIETLWLNCSTCFLMYSRKASLDHLASKALPKSMPYLARTQKFFSAASNDISNEKSGFAGVNNSFYSIQ